MGIMGINLKKINLERNTLAGEVIVKSIKNNINLRDIKETKLPFGDLKGLIFTFDFTSEYLIDKPKDGSLGTLALSCDVVFDEDVKLLKKILADWNKKKKIDEEVMYPILQTAFDFLQIEAISLSRKVLLPSPIQLPKIKPPSGQG